MFGYQNLPVSAPSDIVPCSRKTSTDFRVAWQAEDSDCLLSNWIVTPCQPYEHTPRRSNCHQHNAHVNTPLTWKPPFKANPQNQPHTNIRQKHSHANTKHISSRRNIIAFPYLSILQRSMTFCIRRRCRLTTQNFGPV